MKLNSTKAVITGGVSGLGLAVAKRLIAAGGSVAMLDVNDAEAAMAEMGTVTMPVALGVGAAVSQCGRHPADDGCGGPTDYSDDPTHAQLGLVAAQAGVDHLPVGVQHQAANNPLAGSQVTAPMGLFAGMFPRRPRRIPRTRNVHRCLRTKPGDLQITQIAKGLDFVDDRYPSGIDVDLSMKA